MSRNHCLKKTSKGKHLLLSFIYGEFMTSLWRIHKELNKANELDPILHLMATIQVYNVFYIANTPLKKKR